MHKYGIIILLLFAGAVLALLAVGYFRNRTEVRRIHDSLDQKCGIPKSVAIFRFKQKTPQGVSVRGTVKLPETALADIDAGIQNQLTRFAAAYPAWTKGLLHTDYRVLVIDPMAVNVETEPGSPALKVFGTQTAGTCIGVFERDAARQPYIVVPHQAGTQWRYRDYFMRSIWHESEHYKESLNDYGVFLSYEGANDVHPHIP